MASTKTPTEVGEWDNQPLTWLADVQRPPGYLASAKLRACGGLLSSIIAV